MKVTIVPRSVIAKNRPCSLAGMTDEMLQATEELHRLVQDVVDVTHEVEEMTMCLENIATARDIFKHVGVRKTVVDVLNTDRALEMLCGSLESLTSLKAFEDSSDAQKKSLWQRIKAAIARFIAMIKQWFTNKARRAMMEREKNIVAKAAAVLKDVKDDELKAKLERLNVEIRFRPKNFEYLHDFVGSGVREYSDVLDGLDKAVHDVNAFSVKAASAGYPESMRDEYLSLTKKLDEAKGAVNQWYNEYFNMTPERLHEGFDVKQEASRLTLARALEHYSSRVAALTQVQARSEKSVKSLEEFFQHKMSDNKFQTSSYPADDVNKAMSATHLLMTNIDSASRYGLELVAPNNMVQSLIPNSITLVPAFIIKHFAGVKADNFDTGFEAK